MHNKLTKMETPTTPHRFFSLTHSHLASGYAYLVLAFSLLFSSTNSASPPETLDPIKITTNDWSSQLVLSHITAGIFQSMGYKTEFFSTTTNLQWGSLSRGISHIQVEVWEGTMGKMFNRMIDSGSLIDAGNHDAKTREEWWYPKHVEKVCPGLPDWKALNQCYELFLHPETAPYGRYLGGPWEKPDKARIRALGMQFHVVRVTHSDELRMALTEAIETQTPIVLFNWTPNWVEAQYQGSFVEFPTYSPECETNASWGVNPQFNYDCGNPKDGWLKKAVWAKFPKKWPCAYRTLKNINFSNAMLSELTLWADIDLLSYENAARKWLEQNKSLWQSWIPQQCR
ncbi:ABC transporter substrate-binding protein [Vibrio sp. Of7-15]|uniref:ABC transporter substrate-binding protein n=1 Tax=Vibrio sp. Of7-15 TaxID=2724879 RepID=UPI001EF36002|nr:ABC transporter substrate-binding protein [Vibrio sp. Of7-15]MCG7496597.1 ABC transporter substrate-binding protein [Vibrio sp. Of7-15]